MKENPKILIVDDRLENLIALEKVLNVFDVDFIRTTSGNEALAMTLMYDFALAIVDIQMPEMDGYETVELMRQEEKTKLLPVIFVSAIYTEDFHIIKGIETGAVDFIPKPIVPVILRGKVKVFLDLYIHKTHLEDLVEKRTLELNKINDKLKLEIAEKKKANLIAEEAKAKALTSDKHKSIFLANMSHEIRTPLNGIIGMTEILKKTNLSKKQIEYVEIISFSGANLISIINDILDFSKIESGQVQLEKINFNLRQKIDDIYKLLKHKAQNKKLTLDFRIDSGVPAFIVGDPLRLKQILINLVNNAIKFTEEGSVTLEIINISHIDDNIKLMFKIIDTGIGISEHGKRKLFKEFSQADASISRKHGGSGLGLSISKNLAKMMNGDIGVISEQGKGSTFWFTAVFTMGEKIDEKRKIVIEEESFTKRKLKILLAEDNKINQRVAIVNLNLMGHKVDVANNGKEAVELFKTNLYDVVLMDIMMPVMDGIEATRLIKELQDDQKIKKGIPIIAMTANALKGDREKLLSQGMDAYISKPYSPEELKAVLIKIL
jgi:two-component system, sensor histidine kinase